MLVGKKIKSAQPGWAYATSYQGDKALVKKVLENLPSNFLEGNGRTRSTEVQIEEGDFQVDWEDNGQNAPNILTWTIYRACSGNCDNCRCGG